MTMQSAGGSENAGTQNSLLAGGDHLPELAAGMLRSVADRARRAGDRRDGVELGEPMRAVCYTARRCGLRAEQLLVVLKDAWRRLPEVRRLNRYESEELLTGVIHDCIEEFYADGPRKEATRGSDGT